MEDEIQTCQNQGEGHYSHRTKLSPNKKNYGTSNHGKKPKKQNEKVQEKEGDNVKQNQRYEGKVCFTQ